MDRLYRKGLIIGLIVSACLTLAVARAEIYKWVDADGNVHFSDQKSSTRAKPVELKATINSYNGSTLPTFERNTNNRNLPPSKDHKLPSLAPKQVVMYSTVWCGFCKKAKDYFKQKGIAYTEKDIEKSAPAKKEYQSLGGGGIPLILVGHQQGTRKLSGFSTTRFDVAYQ